MARALARGWAEPVLCTDGGSGRSRALVAELGGEALATNAELAERADVVVLCHKPAQLEAVAAEVAGRARVVASVLAGVDLRELREAYGSTPVLRLLPNTPVEIRQGVICYVDDVDVDRELMAEVLALFERLGDLVALPERLLGAATGVASVTPAYLALVAEAQIDAGIAHGLSATQATELVTGALAGAGALLRARGGDVLAIKREVASPGGVTARGLAALERRGVRAAFLDAQDAVNGRERR